MRKLGIILSGVAMLVASCAPTARYFTVDVKDRDAVHLPLDNRPVAVLSVSTNHNVDSIRVGNVAIGVAEKIEADKSLEKGDVGVYFIPKQEFDAVFDVTTNLPTDTLNPDMYNVDTDYMQQLMIKSGAHVFVFVENLRYGQYSTQKSPVYGDYDNVNVLIPYSVDMGVYDAISDKMLLWKQERDTVYLQTLSSVVAQGKTGGVITSYLPQMSRKIGTKLGSYLSPQWETRERMLISFEGDSSWEAAYLLAQEFKWNEAIEKWMKLSVSENPKKAAYAAFNIAVGCEMLEQFDLARKWVDVSLKKYRFQEAIDLKRHLEEL